MSGTGTPTPRLTAINHPAHSLLTRAHSPDTAASIFTSKVRQKPLLLQPTAPDASDRRALRRHLRLRKKSYYLSKRRPRPLSAKEKRSLGVHDLKPEEVKYEIYAGLHQIWVGYLWEVLGITENGAVKWNEQRSVTAQGHGSLLASADFHGARVEVVRCRCVVRVGLKGVVVRDTKFTFVIVTEKDEVRIVPKKDTLFRYKIPLPDEGGQVPEGEEGKFLVFELHGNQFETRPADRATKKFKWRAADYL